MEGWDPTFLVGIDFGMTCTAVAYSSADYEWATTYVVQEWPGLLPGSCSKYATRVAYDGNNNLVDWGECKVSNDPNRIEREFKIYLDPGFRDRYEGAPSHEDAVNYYRDYMKYLYDHINRYFGRFISDWQSRNVEFRLSIPTTWTNPQVSEQLKGWLEYAGFRNSHNRRVFLSQTEAEAAAVYAAKHYRKGDVIMVVDAGGATTDINTLVVEERTPQITRLKALDKAEGVNVGSVLIDTRVKAKIRDQLSAMQIQSDVDLLWIAEEMMDASDFEIVKCKFEGQEYGLNSSMDVPGHPRQKVVLRSSELKTIFDQLIQQLITTIRSQMRSLHLSQPHRQIHYIVLSGGLGSSPYVQRRLREEFCTGVHRPTNANNMQILLVPDPQLAVAKGLVMDRSQKIERGVEIYYGKCCRQSYGVVVRLPYDAKKHYGEPPIKDEFDGKLWVEDQIIWLIKKGEVVPDDGLSKRFSLKVPKGNELEIFRAHIVMSEAAADHLPSSRGKGPSSKLCVVIGRFSRSDFVDSEFRVVRKFFNKNKEHYVTDFDLKLIVGSADLTFEIISANGQKKFTQNTAKVQVEWEQVTQPPPIPDVVSQIFPANVSR